MFIENGKYLIIKRLNKYDNDYYYTMINYYDSYSISLTKIQLVMKDAVEYSIVEFSGNLVNRKEISYEQ